MKRKKTIISLLVAIALVLTTAFPSSICAGAKTYAKKTKYYTISKQAGTYSSAIKVKVKAKKGYRIYYKTSGKFKKAKVIASGKSKIFRISKTTTLSLCAVKKTVKVTNRKLNKVFRKKKTAYYAKYKYKISKAAVTASPSNDTSAASPSESAAPVYTDSPAASTANPEATDKTQEDPGGTQEDPSETQDAEGKEDAQNKLDEAEEQTASSATPSPTKTPVVIEEDTPEVTLAANGISTENLAEDAVSYTEDGTRKLLTIHQAGTYVLSGGSVTEPITNTEILVDGDISEEVSLIWDNLVIDNSALGTEEGEDEPVFYVGKSTSDVHITLKGSSVLTGNGAYTDSPASAVICANDTGTTVTFSAYAGDDTASLTVKDAMASDTDFGDNDPSDGMYCKGTLVLESGIYSVTSNGDCLKGTGKNGEGGIIIQDGQYMLYSAQGGALKSKNGNILIYGGTVESEYTAEDGIQAKNYDVVIMGGTIGIDQCYGDGIQGETVKISGEDTVINIKTYFENAGVNYYNSALGTGNYNTMTSTNDTKTEVVCVDTGSHKGIKGGTKAHTYSYESVEEDSDYTAGTTYSTEASGGIVISGGTISVDTTNAGIKYNGSSGNSGMGNQPGSSSSSSGNLSAANSDGQYIIGAPDDGIHSNNTCTITGGTINIASSDDGLTGPEGILIMNSADVTISKCYEGIEGGEIIIGSSQQTTDEPTIKVYSDDDGVNAASKSLVSYVYEDESEEKYTKTETASQDNTLQILSGYLNVMIADDETHQFSLATADGEVTTSSYTSDGDGIDCNGSFYAYGGTVVVFGADSNDNAPIDTDGDYYIGSGVTLLATGNTSMTESPTDQEQAVVTYGGSSTTGSGASGNTPGGNGPGSTTSGGTSAMSANTAFAIMQDTEVLLAMKPVKDYNYVLYSSPDLVNGSSYTIYSGGSVSGSLVQTDSSAWDYRYTGYDTSGATVLSTVTAQK